MIVIDCFNVGPRIGCSKDFILSNVFDKFDDKLYAEVIRQKELKKKKEFIEESNEKIDSKEIDECICDFPNIIEMSDKKDELLEIQIKNPKLKDDFSWRVGFRDCYEWLEKRIKKEQ